MSLVPKLIIFMDIKAYIRENVIEECEETVGYKFDLDEKGKPWNYQCLDSTTHSTTYLDVKTDHRTKTIEQMIDYIKTL